MRADGPDIVIVGTGASAMLLADALIRRECYGTLRLVGPERPLRARRMAWWEEAGDGMPFSPFADAQWTAIEVVAADGRPMRLPLTRFTYRSMPARAWHAGMLERVRSAPRVEIIDRRVDDLNAIDGDWIFDSAGLAPTTPTTHQRFEGWELELATPLTQLDMARLMDFRTAAAGDFQFVYALPLAPRRLFVEHVSYRPAPHAALITAYVRDALGVDGWRVVERETGATPAYRVPPLRRQGRVVTIGAAAGMAKAATGYALTRMWRDAQRIADDLARAGEPIVERRRCWLYGVADRMFVDLVQRAPERLPVFLERLFASASADAVLGFLDDRATAVDRLAVSRAAPGWLRWLLSSARAA